MLTFVINVYKQYIGRVVLKEAGDITCLFALSVCRGLVAGSALEEEKPPLLTD